MAWLALALAVQLAFVCPPRKQAELRGAQLPLLPLLAHRPPAAYTTPRAATPRAAEPPADAPPADAPPADAAADAAGSDGGDSAASDDSRAIEQCQSWIEHHVIRLGLCPYASKPYVNDRVRYVVSGATDNGELLEDFFNEGSLLLDAPQEELETTMLIAPHYAQNIEEYESLIDYLTELLESPEETLLRNGVQPAFFHANWTFAGMQEDDAIHYEKRAPCTVINLLRRAQLDAAVKEGIERGVIVNKQISEHNEQALTEEGTDAMRNVFAQIRKGALKPSVEPPV
jgi:hypothetical protein